jgi:hypothetical protein
MRAKRGVTTWVLGVCALAASALACGDNKPAQTSAAESVCTGTAVACGLLSSSQCAAAAGCAPGACSGTAMACDGLTSTTECLLQQGCAPSGSNNTCGGVALSCPALTADAECRGQKGCAWQEGCFGRVAACGSLNATACGAQPGCHLSTTSATDGGAPAEGGAPTPGNCDDAGVPAQLVIDDMEDQTQGISGSDSYGGWYVFDDDTVGAHMTPPPRAPFTMEPIPGGRCASEYAMRLTGTGFTQWGAGMGFDFGYGSSSVAGVIVKVPVDGRAYSGIRFWARVGQATTTQANFSMLAGSCPPDSGADGGGNDATVRAPSDCALSYPKKLVLTTDWVRYDIGFDTLLSNPDRLPIPRDQLYSVGFTVAPSTTFDLWIDDISWIPAEPAP